ncbi:DUF6074 family protein [Phyllobacterium sp. 21LDTY02-6]|jgi:tRNA(His) 5'-end guanylyltransferase|uniref:DUF6074 family protein n=1 Tax=unclassified Phyllobacterium TaxID=2638441 RepID=UPI0020225597|nr:MULTISPECIES: DUF6074 family protein [unclassified Phyllobacterium]MCO4317495.1 DUF6074 family protein [Phyllobacterium sp. 21LDTY02-6]MCX8293128.1 DUF6074 family protein [Phyllobacterium sp. 0TCS1.6A]
MNDAETAAPCRIIAFPLARRAAKIREVAARLMEKTSERNAEAYRNQVANALFRQLSKSGVCEDEQDEQIGAFFTAVEYELDRLFASRGIYGDLSSY